MRANAAGPPWSTLCGLNTTPKARLLDTEAEILSPCGYCGGLLAQAPQPWVWTR